MFAVYMRYVLTPLSAMTWANLNHTLCGIDNDPWRAFFGMHKYFYFWGDAYLGFSSMVFNYLNILVARLISKDLFYSDSKAITNN